MNKLEELKSKWMQQIDQQISEIKTEIESIVEAEQQLLVQKQEELLQRQQKWEKMNIKLTAVAIPNRVKIDVGGRVFTTTKSTLMNSPSEFFKQMFNGTYEIHPEEDGSYFIDRNGRVFEYVLDHLRGREIPFRLLSPLDMDFLEQDANFYEIDSLNQQLKEYCSANPLPITKPVADFAWREAANYQVSERTVTKTGENSWDASVMSKHPLSGVGVVEFSVLLTKTTYSHIMIGVSPPYLNQTKKNNYTDGPGYYYYCGNGKLYSKQANKQCADYPGGRPLKSGEEVGVSVDFTNQTISFIVAGENKGVAYDFTSGTELYPVVMFANAGDSVALIKIT